MNSSGRRARRNADRVLIDTLWRLGGAEAAQQGARELGRTVRCPQCLGQKQLRNGWTVDVCPCCQGAGVMKHRVRARAPALAFPGNPTLDASRRRWLGKATTTIL